MTENVQTLNDVIDPARARAMQTLLGQEATIATEDTLPAFFHQLYFWDPQPPSRLGRDGHPKVGGIIPDMGLPLPDVGWRAAGNYSSPARRCASRAANDSGKS